MLSIQQFTFGPFQENTFLIWDENKDAVLIDPGMYDRSEEEQFLSFLEAKELNLKQLWNTHAHIDHVMGNAFIKDKFGLDALLHKEDLMNLERNVQAAHLYGINYPEAPMPVDFIDEGDELHIGEHSCKVIFTPGHAPGHVVFYFENEGFVINGDVLFQGSVGRVDLPGGDPKVLEASIRDKMYKLPDETVVYCGHGPQTTIGTEKRTNYFVWDGGSRL